MPDVRDTVCKVRRLNAGKYKKHFCNTRGDAGTLGRRVTRNTQPMPLTSWPAASCASLRQCNWVPVLLFLKVILQQAWVHNGVYQFSTKSRRMRKDEGRPGKKTADKLGRILVRNTQPMPLTSWRAASCASLRRYLTRVSIFHATKSQRVRKDEGKPGKKTAGKLGSIMVRNTQLTPLTSRPAATKKPPALFQLHFAQKFPKSCCDDEVRGLLYFCHFLYHLYF